MKAYKDPKTKKWFVSVSYRNITGKSIIHTNRYFDQNFLKFSD